MNRRFPVTRRQCWSESFVVASEPFSAVGQSMFLDRRGNFRAGNFPRWLRYRSVRPRYRRMNMDATRVLRKRGRLPRPCSSESSARDQIGDPPSAIWLDGAGRPARLWHPAHRPVKSPGVRNFPRGNSFFHPARTASNLLERADAVDRTVRPDDERVDVAALDVQPRQPDVTTCLRLQHRSDAGRFRRCVGYHMNWHDFQSVSAEPP